MSKVYVKLKVLIEGADINDDELDQEVYFRLIDWFSEVNKSNVELPDYTIVEEED